MYKPTLKDIEEAASSYFKEKELDDSVYPDLEIVETEDMFLVTINAPKMKLRTGLGGLKLMLERGLPIFKVKYNNKILTKKQYEQLHERVLHP